MSEYLNARHQPMAAYVPGEQPRASGLIKLNTNESPFPPSPRAVQAVTREALESLRLYSDIPATELCAAIAQETGVSPGQVIAANGSDEVLAYCFLAYGDQGAIFADITYGFYQVWSALYGVDARIVPLRDDFSIDPSDYVGSGRMVVVANPNAPTGLALSRAAIEQIVRTNQGNVVVVDEAYVDFGGESAVGLIDRYDNLIVTQTFSKSRSLAGGRLGFAVASEALIGDLNKMKFSLNPYNVNALTQLMGAQAMRDRAYFDDCRQAIVRAREYAALALKDLGFTVLPSKANFLLAAPGRMGGAAYQKALREKNILVRHFAQPRIDGFVRISIGTMAQMQALIRATEEVLS